MKHWKFPSESNATSLLERLLASRNIISAEKIDEFLHPENTSFLPFEVFNSSEIVLNRIDKAVQNGEKIIIYGDFDTDGVTSTAIMYKALKQIGANVGYYLPNRDAESHGLNNKAIINLISKQKAKLIITVDCGVSNNAEVKLAKTFKTDVIITDHHEAPEELPEAFAIINPKARGVLDESLSSKDIESLCYLSGAGVAFKLASSVLQKHGQDDFINDLIPIAALGTIGDIVPLLMENRHIAYSGLIAIRNKVNKGISKLFENAGVKDFSGISSETVAFTAVPRINATGRLDSADCAFKLLVSDDDDELDKITKNLNDINSLRQDLCHEAFERANKIVQSNPMDYQNSIVICDEDAHVGIIGLSASRLVETYNLPAFVMRKDDNIYRCSCRGLKGINIFDVLNANKDLFIGFGGHEFAGGFSFDGNIVSFDKVKTAIDESVKEQTNGQKLENYLNVDAKISPDDVNFDLIEIIKKLEPFGAANPEPVFVLENLKVCDYKFMGQNNNHLKLFCNSKDGKVFECIKWSTDSFENQKGEAIEIAFAPEINQFNGKTTIQLLLKDMHFSNNKKSETVDDSFKIIDCRNQSGGYDKIVDFIENHQEMSVAVFSEKSDVIKFFENNEFSKNKTFSRDNIPQNSDMLILVDMPPSLHFLKNLKINKTKKILLMKYDNELFPIQKLFSKLAGMMKYTLTSLGGETTISALRNPLSLDDDLIRDALGVLSETGFFEWKIFENGKIEVKSLHSSTMSKLSNSPKFNEFEKKYNEYSEYILRIKNSSFEELKKLILN